MVAEQNVHHNVHSTELRPHLYGGTENHTTDNARRKEITVGLGTLLALKVHLSLDFLVFQDNKLIAFISFAVQICQNLKCLLLSTMVDEPPRRFGEESHAYREDDGGDHLEGPWDAEGCDAVNIGAAELNEILNEDTPCDGPLLKRDNAATDSRGGDFGLIQGNDGRGETDGDTGNDTSSYEHTAVLVGGKDVYKV